MSYDMQNQFDPRKRDEALSMAFRAYLMGLTNTLAAVDEALDTITEAHVVEKDSRKIVIRPRALKRPSCAARSPVVA